MANKNTFGREAVVDDQGDSDLCVKAAASKAIVNGLWHCKWTKSKFDADQNFVFGLLNGDKVDKLEKNQPHLPRWKKASNKKWRKPQVDRVCHGGKNNDPS